MNIGEYGSFGSKDCAAIIALSYGEGICLSSDIGSSAMPSFIYTLDILMLSVITFDFFGFGKKLSYSSLAVESFYPSLLKCYAKAILSTRLMKFFIYSIYRLKSSRERGSFII